MVEVAALDHLGGAIGVTSPDFAAELRRTSIQFRLREFQVANHKVERDIVELIGLLEGSVNDKSPRGSRLGRAELLFKE